jgi:glycerate 2-kinase
MLTTAAQRQHLEAIFRAGLQRVDPYRMVVEHLRLEGSRLRVASEDHEEELDLDAYERVLVIGAGKASATMARAVEDLLGDRLDGGLVVVKYGHTDDLARIEILEAGHPVPDDNGVAAARRIAALADQADAKTLVIALISGGGSALLPMPLEYTDQGQAQRLGLADKQTVTRELLACGADIREINCIRKHLSGLKGGRLLARLAPARSLNLILSDVVGDDLSSIASGMTTVDPSTFAEAAGILDRYGITRQVPEAVRRILTLGLEGHVPETLKPEEFDPARVTNHIIGSNRAALLAAAAHARELGYRVAALTTRITGEAREVARFLAGIARDTSSQDLLAEKPACIISGGEPVVTLKGLGKGGRNQEMALAFLEDFARQPEEMAGIAFLAASTDGNDGPTDAAGAFADGDLLAEARDRGLSFREYLADNDAYNFYAALGGLLKTGPTNTNVCDLHILLVDHP